MKCSLRLHEAPTHGTLTQILSEFFPTRALRAAHERIAHAEAEETDRDVPVDEGRLQDPDIDTPSGEDGDEQRHPHETSRDHSPDSAAQMPRMQLHQLPLQVQYRGRV